MKCRTCCSPGKDFLLTLALLFPTIHCSHYHTLYYWFTFLITEGLPLSAAPYGVCILSSGTPGNCSILFSVGPEYAAETFFLRWPSL